MTPDQLALGLLLAPVAFVAALFILPIDLWLLPLRAIGWAWGALLAAFAWPLLFLISLSDPKKADRHKSWWAARAARVAHLTRAIFGRP